MSYLAPSEFVPKLVDAGEAKILMSTKDTLIRAYMAGATLAVLPPVVLFVILQRFFVDSVISSGIKG